MELEVNKTGQINLDIKVGVDKEALKGMSDKVLDKINKDVNIPGFRKGKAPLDLVAKRFPDLVKKELINEAVPFYYNRALEKENLSAVGLPKIKDAEYKDGHLSFVAQVEIKTEFKVDSKIYRQIKIKDQPLEVDDKETEKLNGQFKENISKALNKPKEDIDQKLISNWAGYQNPDEFRKAVTSELYLNKVVQRRRSFEKQISEALLNKVKFPVPESVIQEQKKGLLSQQIQTMYSKGIPQEDIKKHYEELSSKSESLARDQVRLYYILEEIAKEEHLEHDNNNIYEVVIGFILSNALK